MATMKWQIFADAGAPQPLYDGELPAQRLQASLSHCGDDGAPLRGSGIALAPSVTREARRVMQHPEEHETVEFPVPKAELTLFPPEGVGDNAAQDATLLCRLQLQRCSEVAVESKEPEPKNGWFELKMARASDYREQGNVAFKQQKLGAAKRLYTRALAWLECPADCVFNAEEQTVATPLAIACHVNLATSLWKLGDTEACIAQCSLALQLDSRHVKARFRRGQALLAIKEFDLALEDLAAALELEPDNQLFALGLERARAAKRQFHRQQREAFGRLFHQ